MRTLPLYLLAALPLTALALPAQKDFPPLLVESQETAAALEAAPEHLRPDAGVYVLDSMGYRRVRASPGSVRKSRVRENRLKTGTAPGSMRNVSKIASASIPSFEATGWRRAPARTQKKGESNITKNSRIAATASVR